MRTGSVSALGFPGPDRFSAKTRKRYFFLVGSPFTLQPRHLVQVPALILTLHGSTCETVRTSYLKVVSLIGSLLHLIHLSLSGSNFSTQ